MRALAILATGLLAASAVQAKEIRRLGAPESPILSDRSSSRPSI